MEYKSDIDLLAGIRQGKEAAFSYCYRAFLPMVRSWILKNNGSRDEADDLFQDAILVIFDKVQKYDFELNAKFSTYLMAICRFQWLKKLKRNKEVGFDDDADDWMLKSVETDLSYHHQKELEFEKLGIALGKLGSPCNDLLKAYYFENKSMQNITEDFDYTNANNAKTQKYKCLQRLKKLFNIEFKNND